MKMSKRTCKVPIARYNFKEDKILGFSPSPKKRKVFHTKLALKYAEDINEFNKNCSFVHFQQDYFTQSANVFQFSRISDLSSEEQKFNFIQELNTLASSYDESKSQSFIQSEIQEKIDMQDMKEANDIIKPEIIIQTPQRKDSCALKKVGEGNSKLAEKRKKTSSISVLSQNQSEGSNGIQSEEKEK